MGCCGKKRARFLNKIQQKVEAEKRSTITLPTLPTLPPEEKSLLEIPDDKLTVRQKRVKYRMLRQKRRAARAARIERRNLKAQKKSTK